MTDPSVFLSTIATVSAAMVAIIGGLLVARFVSLDSQQQGTRQLLGNAQARLTAAQARARSARDSLRARYVSDFFTSPVIRAIGEGTTDVDAIRRIGRDTELTDEELSTSISEIVSEFSTARTTLPRLLPSPDDGDYEEWHDFRLRVSGFPPVQWDQVWEISYEDLRYPPQPRPQVILGQLLQPTISASLPTPREYIVLRIQQLTSLQAQAARTQQQVEDIEAEVNQLERALDAIVKPRGLGLGLFILAAFTIVGVIVPLWIMSRGSQKLAPDLRTLIFWLFATGLIALLSYMTSLALRLSGWHLPRRRSSKPGLTNPS